MFKFKTERQIVKSFGIISVKFETRVVKLFLTVAKQIAMWVVFFPTSSF